jgi:MinD superfamily P-loop ATPase
MHITIASGKGGTGKTTLATSLALSLAEDGILAVPPLFLDCDVEAPNAHIFLAPAFTTRQDVPIQIPQVNQDRCQLCGTCAEVCQFHAITVIGSQVLVFPQLCHGCGACMRQCPEQAITEVPSVIGVLERGVTKCGMEFGRGKLNVGEPMAVPIIRQLKAWIPSQPGQVVITDAPPGTSCPVVETIRGADVVLLVTEPTPFGLHDLRLAAEVTRELDLPVGVIINRDGSGYHEVEQFCESAGLPILLRIPFDRALSEGIARGKSLVAIRPEYRESLHQLYADTQQLLAAHHRTPQQQTAQPIGVHP